MRQKYPDKHVKLVCGSYFDVEFGMQDFDAVVSFQTMHHFSHSPKKRLYGRIRYALGARGSSIECDYMVADPEVEDGLHAKSAKIRSELGIADGEFCHLDTPCTVNNQIAMFKGAGLASAENVFRVGNTTIVVAKKD